jgi:hypothetical protein
MIKGLARLETSLHHDLSVKRVDASPTGTERRRRETTPQ